MKKRNRPDIKNRRQFLKISAAGATSLLVPDSINIVNAEESGWQRGKRINSAIDNLRVVSCYDPKMVSGTPATTVLGQNSCINKNQVHANLDEMAKKLADKATAAEAWAAIFSKPTTKEWSAVKVAFKVNCINTSIMPRAAIIEKICMVLNNMGVPYTNMIIYDGCSNASGSKYDTLKTNGYLPTGVVVSNGNGSLGGTTSTPIPSPATQGTGTCTKNIADGTIDILINCAVNKGHSVKGNATLCMKNHYGTFTPICSDFNYLIGINKSSAIVGGTPARQQLCIMDSIFAAVNGPGAAPDKTPYRILMGVFAAAVDYCTCVEVRKAVMGCPDNAGWKEYLTAFGYSDSQCNSLVSIIVPSATIGIVDKTPKNLNNCRQVQLHFSNSSIKGEMEPLYVDKNEKILRAAILDIRGKVISPLDIVDEPGTNSIMLHATPTAGRKFRLSSKPYFVVVEGNGFSHQSQLFIRK